MRETYKVKRPDRITWGDPSYMEEFSGEKLKSLIVDFQPPQYYDARVVLDGNNPSFASSRQDVAEPTGRRQKRKSRNG